MRLKRDEDAETALLHAKSALTLYRILNDAKQKVEMLLLIADCERARLD